MAAKRKSGGDPVEGEDFPTGPELGQPVPAFTLPDQSGKPVSYPPDGGGKAYILFHRSASW